ncbi:DUF1853 family protein [Marinobacterium sp. YM272]|uniref:DUF1853 family protein n=1 Tax=Marinobacterium sp. YM272 TaxID=3421654 RepID=UPI003D7F3235
MNSNPPIRTAPDSQCLLAELEWLRTSPDLMLAPQEYRCPEAIKAGTGTITKAGNLAALSSYEPRWRLGEHFENIVYFHLKNNEQISDIYRNIQVKEDKRTVGEMDFLFRFDAQWIHLEVALKLYLLDGNGQILESYIGTRRDDCLATKWQHMLEHQLRLCQRPEAAKQLEKLCVSSQPTPVVWVKGWLFYHPAQNNVTAPYPVNPEHLRGWWVTWSELALIASEGERYILVRKPDWLLPAAYLGNPALTLAELREQLRDLHRSSLVLAVVRINGEWVERSRGFVVPDHWPAGRR